jgi:hypothetical protein
MNFLQKLKKLLSSLFYGVPTATPESPKKKKNSDIEQFRQNIGSQITRAQEDNAGMYRLLCDTLSSGGFLDHHLGKEATESVEKVKDAVHQRSEEVSEFVEQSVEVFKNLKEDMDFRALYQERETAWGKLSRSIKQSRIECLNLTTVFSRPKLVDFIDFVLIRECDVLLLETLDVVDFANSKKRMTGLQKDMIVRVHHDIRAVYAYHLDFGKLRSLLSIPETSNLGHILTNGVDKLKVNLNSVFEDTSFYLKEENNIDPQTFNVLRPQIDTKLLLEPGEIQKFVKELNLFTCLINASLIKLSFEGGDSSIMDAFLTKKKKSSSLHVFFENIISGNRPLLLFTCGFLSEEKRIPMVDGLSKAAIIKAYSSLVDEHVDALKMEDTHNLSAITEAGIARRSPTLFTDNTDLFTIFLESPKDPLFHDTFLRAIETKEENQASVYSKDELAEIKSLLTKVLKNTEYSRVCGIAVSEMKTTPIGILLSVEPIYHKTYID